MIDLRLGDCIEVMKTLPDNSVDSIVCDPPYHLTSSKDGKKGFMGKEWDGGDIAFRTEVWKEALRVLKPGGHLLAFGGSRTYHRLAVAIEDAGFEIRDQIMWIYGSGFPKSHNIGKAIDKIQGNEREVVGDYETSIPQITPWKDVDRFESKNQQTKGSSEWEGWGTALKPAHEPIVMARKPLSEKSVAENVLKWGTGGINIDESRIDYKGETPNLGGRAKHTRGDGYGFKALDENIEANLNGRFPANVILDDEAGKILDEQTGVLKSGKMKPTHKRHTDGSPNGIYGKFDPNHPISETYGDSGGASRFFYCPKASKKEKDLGLDNLTDKPRPGQSDKGLYSSSPYCIDCGKTINGTNNHSDCKEGLEYKPSNTTGKNIHPTIKPIALMEYLIKLITKPGGVVLDCFMGSGSTGVAATRNGYSFIGIEKEPEYIEIAQQRIDYEC